MSAGRINGVELKLGIDVGTLAYAYGRWQAEDLFPEIFHRTPGWSLIDFLDWNYRPTVEPVGCYVDDELVGIGWICQARIVDGAVAAEVGAAFFRGTPLAVWKEALDKLMRFGFEEKGFAVVYGVSSPHNPAAELLTRLCGMQPVDHLPWPEEVPEGTVITRLRREEWRLR